MQTIALVAHDSKKDEMIEFAKAHREILSKYKLVATSTTGTRIQKELGLDRDDRADVGAFFAAYRAYDESGVRHQQGKIKYSLELSRNRLGEFYLTHEQIALLSGLNRVTVTKLMSEVLR